MLLGVVLLYCGFRLCENALAIRSDQNWSRANLATEQKLPFTAAKGINVYGKPVSVDIFSKDHPLGVFLLRGRQLEQDLTFWRSVSDLVVKKGLTLVAYCDGLSCSDGVRKLASPPPFEVIEYGEAVSSQALLNDDREGNCLKLVDSKKRPKKVGWRSAESTPVKVAMELNAHDK